MNSASSESNDPSNEPEVDVTVEEKSRKEETITTAISSQKKEDDANKSFQSDVGLPDSGSTVEPLSTASPVAQGCSVSRSSSTSQSQSTESQPLTLRLELEETQDVSDMSRWQKQPDDEVEVAEESDESKRIIVTSESHGPKVDGEVSSQKRSADTSSSEVSPRKKAKAIEASHEEECSLFDMSHESPVSQTEQSVVVLSPREEKTKETLNVSDHPGDNSVIILGEQQEERTKPNDEHIEDKLSSVEPRPKLSIAVGQNSPATGSATTTSSSESLFSKLKTNFAAAEKDGGDISMMSPESSKDNSCNLSMKTSYGSAADDEHSGLRSLTVESSLSRTTLSSVHQGLNDAHSFSVSPIEKNSPDARKKKTPSGKVSSTPGGLARRRQLSRKTKEKSPSTDEEEAAVTEPKVRRSPVKRNSGRQDDQHGNDQHQDEGDFKVPVSRDNVLKLFVVGSHQGLSQEEVEYLRSILTNIPHIELDVPKDQANKLHKMPELRHFLAGSPTLAHSLSSSRRLSDSSSSSGLSGSTRPPSGTGYCADSTSSGGSSLTLSLSSGDSGKRSRLSTIPETSIEPHSVISPLPQARYKKLLGSDGLREEKESPPLEITELPEGRTSSPKKERGELSKKAEAPLNPSKIIAANRLVFAKFRERTMFRYWPAKVDGPAPGQDDNDCDRWMVTFCDDGNERELPTNELIPLDSLLPGQSMEVTFNEGGEEGMCQTANLVAYPDLSQPGVVGYQVRFENIEGIPQLEEKLVNASRDVFLTAAQAAEAKKGLGGIWNTPTVSRAELDLGNVIQGPRGRRKAVVTPKSTPRRKRGGDAVETSATEPESENSHSKGARRRLPSTSSDDKENSSTPQRRSRRKGSDLTWRPEDLFKGMVFLLTQGTRPPYDAYGGPETETEEDSELNRSTTSTNMLSEPPFERSLIRRKIIEHGGKILSAFPGEKRSSVPAQLIVVSDCPCETMTFLLAITYAFPRVSHQWVLHSAAQRRRLDLKDYYLAVGFSPSKGRMMEHHEVQGMSTLLKGRHVLLASASEEWTKDWKVILMRMDAAVYVKTREGDRITRNQKAVHVVVADKSAPKSLVKDAKEKGISVVSARWIVQCLVNGQIMDYEKFLIG